MNKEIILNAVGFGVVPVTVGAINMGVVALGHTFSLAARTGLLHGGIIGVIQSLVARTLFQHMETLMKELKDYIPKGWELPVAIGSLCLSVVLSGIALFTISALAVKAGIIASTISLSTMTLLTLANCVLSIGGICGELFLDELFESESQPNASSKF